MKTLAFMCLRSPEAKYSDEAIHAGLLFAHMAWNRLAGVANDYKPVLRQFVESKPDLFRELISFDPEAIIAELAKAKIRLWPDDERIVLLCGTLPGGRLRVEWCWPEELAETAKLYGMQGDGGCRIFHYDGNGKNREK